MTRRRLHSCKSSSSKLNCCINRKLNRKFNTSTVHRVSGLRLAPKGGRPILEYTSSRGCGAAPTSPPEGALRRMRHQEYMRAVGTQSDALRADSDLQAYRSCHRRGGTAALWSPSTAAISTVGGGAWRPVNPPRATRGRRNRRLRVSPPPRLADSGPGPAARVTSDPVTCLARQGGPLFPLAEHKKWAHARLAHQTCVALPFLHWPCLYPLGSCPARMSFPARLECHIWIRSFGEQSGRTTGRLGSTGLRAMPLSGRHSRHSGSFYRR
jgi:hypothetical protein